MSNIPAMYNRDAQGVISGVTFYLNMTPYQSDRSHPGFPELLAELKKSQPDEARLVALTQPIQAVKEAVKAAEAADYLPAGVVGVTSNEITYNGEPIKGVLVDRILAMLSEGFDIMPMVKFLENVYLNPAPWSRDDLYLWLENGDMPITADGHFLAYKMVHDDYTSRGGFMNQPGTTVSLPRQQCDPDRDALCSTGLHFCSKGYIGTGYMGSGGGKIVMLKINPADVVAIPNEYGHAKGRAWKYEILGDFNESPHAKVWPSVVDESGDSYDEDTDDSAEWLEFPSELASALFAAYGEITEDPSDRETRIEWANASLGLVDDEINSFSDLTKEQARELIDYARDVKAVLDEAAEAQADDAQAEAEVAAALARIAKIDAINSYGIVKLRKLTGKWKGYKAKELRKILIDRL